MPMKEPKLKKRSAIPQITKVRALLQKEINSRCPMNDCGDQDVQYFEIHHIDSNTSNNKIENLLLVCRKCHAKITSGELEYYVVKKVKNNVNNLNGNIEFILFELDDTRCAWKNYKHENAAFYSMSKRSNPVFMCNFINHYNKTLMLSHIKIKSEVMFSGFSGHQIEMKAVNSAANYSFPLFSQKKQLRYPLDPPIQIPASSAARFSVAFHLKGHENEKKAITGRWLIEITLCFGSRIEKKIDRICLNCKDENDRPMLAIYY